jgi:hypothetical protein
MKIFHCDHCQQLVFFENVQCLKCYRPLAYLPDLGVVGSLEPVRPGVWRCSIQRAAEQTYRLCENYDRENICNWAVLLEDSHPLCRSCRLTRVIPDLNQQGHKEAWYRLEVAKRRLAYSLLSLGLPLENRVDNPTQGLAFEFLADSDASQAGPRLTGHLNGVITINVAEADDAEREKRRLQMHEPYRTLLGHFRHESGHYYWDRLVKDSDRVHAFRNLFGDEREDYAEALRRHYEQIHADWQQRFVSAYASAHPWEDWAETWAHYLHMADALETAAACGLALRPHRPDEPSLNANAPSGRPKASFDRMIDGWFPLTYVLNNLNRGLGLPDSYPFVLSTLVIDKLRFVHETLNCA